MSRPPLKTRFAPSPTGLLHLGNVRTALFNALLARGRGGRLLLRIEDTDAVRGHEKYAEALLRDLRWLGLDWQEGPEAGGDAGPYYQSQRGPIYARYFEALESRGLAYRCFCSEHELAVARRTQLAAGKPPRYNGRCRVLDPVQVRERLAAGAPATLRFRVPDGERVAFADRVRGRQEFATDDIGDFVIRRSDGTPAFFFSNAIDDATMGVDLVVRGEDHLTNTPRQLLLLRALDLSAPDYAHIALVVDADGAPLSKRGGSLSVQALREAGWLPAAINNYLARLGHTYESNDLMDFDALAAHFAVERLHRAPAHFDAQQLRHWQKEAVLAAPEELLWAWLDGHACPDNRRIRDLVPSGSELYFVRAVRPNIVLPDDAHDWAMKLYAETGRFDHDARSAIRAAGADFFNAALARIDSEGGDFKAYSRAVAQTTGVKGKGLYMPLRAALTGTTHGPELDQLWTLLGEQRVRRHLESALALLDE
ncbi:MAG TPA: glutamate--tRNA ligase [Acidiferrobacterales bacterium]